MIYRNWGEQCDALLEFSMSLGILWRDVLGCCFIDFAKIQVNNAEQLAKPITKIRKRD
jgi:hypothetical protein